MTAIASRVPCPVEGCAYTMDVPGSIPAHVAMAHPEVPMDRVAPKRSARNAPIGDHPPAAPPVPPTGGAALAEIPLDLVDVGANVRVNVAELEELAASIAEHGVLQPVKVFPSPDGRYRLVWGQRRVLAAREAGLATIPAIVAPFDEAAGGAPRSIEQLVENLHRADLNPIDRAQAMRAVVDSGVSQAELARKLGIAPSTVANDLRLLTLDERVLERIRIGELTASHGKAIASLPAKQQRSIAERVVGAKLSSKDLERELEWRRQEAELEEAKKARTDKLIPKAIAAMEAAGVPQGAAVYVSGEFYTFDVERVRREIAAAGWAENGGRVLGPRPDQGKCDCTAVRLELSGRSCKVTPACSDDRHRDRQRNVDHQLEEAARKAFEARKVAVQREIERQLRASALHPLVLELLDKAVKTYHDGRARAERDVVAELAVAIVQTWRVRESITPELLAELGIAEVAS